jgi:hypothetical protein
MREVIQAAEAQTFGADAGITGDSGQPDSIPMVIYPVRGDVTGVPRYESVPQELQAMQQDAAAQAATWQLFIDLIPTSQRSMISQYVIFSDGPGDILASVQQSYGDPARWMLEVDSADLGDRRALMFTLVHEFAHLLTLNASQVSPDLELFNDPEDEALRQRKLQACPNYFPGEGCSREGSYINAFYNRFWLDIADEWQQVDDLSTGPDIEGYYEALYAFYEAHQDQFVDDYATTNPSEDMAETFAYFVFEPAPAGDSLAEQKILFYQEYPELVQLREQILRGFCEVAQ